jgi:arylsulfatase A-like enzyme
MKVVVVTARGLGAWALGCYGNTWIGTPHLDALAAAGVVFDQHRADRADPEGARRTWRGGCYNLPRPDQSDGGPTNPPDLIEALRRAGVPATLIREGGQTICPAFEKNWDSVLCVGTEGGFERTLEAFEGALENLAGNPSWMIWVDLQGVMPPWHGAAQFLNPENVEENDLSEGEEGASIPPLDPILDPKYGPIDLKDDDLYLSLQEGYAAAVRGLDANIGQLMEASGDPDVALIFTADHGFPLGEHAWVGEDSPWPHEELVHVPLILRLPQEGEAGRRVAALSQAVDLAPTLANLFDVTLEGAHGRSLVPLARGSLAEVRPYSCSGIRACGTVARWSIRSKEWALFVGPDSVGDETNALRLFVKPDDAWEINNVVQHHPDLAEQLEKALFAFLSEFECR